MTHAAHQSRPAMSAMLRVMLVSAIAAMPSRGLMALPKAMDPATPPHLSDLDPSELDSAITERLDALRQTRSAWAWSDLIERGRLAVAEGDFSGAAIIFEASVQSADEPIERLVSLQLLGRALLHDGQTMPASSEREREVRSEVLREAGLRLNQAQVEAPMSRDIAAGRVAAWSQAGDDLETLAAEHQLRVIDPSMEGTARMDPLTAAVVCYAVFKAGQLILKHYDFGGHLKPEHRAAMLGAMDLAVSASLVGLPFSGQATDYGIDFIESVMLD